MEENNKIKITNPERVVRILRRICQGSLPVMIRVMDNVSIAVKGRAAAVVVESGIKGMRISNVSDKGIFHLKVGSKVQVEFVMMATKVVFVSMISMREQSSLIVDLPLSLVSIERRKNARFPTTRDLSAFLELSIWMPNGDDLTAPPTFPHYRDLGARMQIVDMSNGGICAVSRFPAVNDIARRGLIDDHSKIIVPMQKPIVIAMEIRWVKKIKEAVKAPDGSIRTMRSYKFGAEFAKINEESLLKIRQFMQQLSQAEAI